MPITNDKLLEYIQIIKNTRNIQTIQFSKIPSPPQINQPLQASNSSKISAAFWASPLLPQASTKAQQAFTPPARPKCVIFLKYATKKLPFRKKRLLILLIQIPKTQTPFFLYLFLLTHYSQGRVTSTFRLVSSRPVRRSGLDQDHKRSSAGTNRWRPPSWRHRNQLEKRTDKTEMKQIKETSQLPYTYHSEKKIKIKKIIIIIIITIIIPFK